MNPALQGYTAAVAEAAGPAALGGLAADLEAIEQLVLANAQLRAALTDTAVPGPARRAVMLDLLGREGLAGGTPAGGLRLHGGRGARGHRARSAGSAPGCVTWTRGRTRSRA